MSKMFKNICHILKIKKINTTAYHPQVNLVESSNHQLKTYLCPNMSLGQLPYFMFQYNTTVNSSTKYSPYELLYGRMARISSSTYKNTDSELSFDTYAKEMKSIFRNMHSLAKQNLITSSKESRKEVYDKKNK